MRSVPICSTEVTRRDLSALRRRETKYEGVVAVVREYCVTWQRKPESTISCLRWSGFASLNRKILCGVGTKGQLGPYNFDKNWSAYR